MAAKKKAKKVVKKARTAFRTVRRPRVKQEVAPPAQTVNERAAEIGIPPDYSKLHKEGPEWDGYVEWIYPLNIDQLRAVVLYEGNKAQPDDPAACLNSASGNSKQVLLEFATLYARARHDAGDAITEFGDIYDYYTPAFEAEANRLTREQEQKGIIDRMAKLTPNLRAEKPVEDTQVLNFFHGREAVRSAEFLSWKRAIYETLRYLNDKVDDLLQDRVSFKQGCGPFDMIRRLAESGAYLESMLKEVEEEAEPVV